MATTNINVRVDTELKHSAEELFSGLGLSMSSAVTMFLKSAVNNNGIPFEILRPDKNRETAAAFAEYDEMEKNPDKYPRYSSAEEMLNDVLRNA